MFVNYRFLVIPLLLFFVQSFMLNGQSLLDDIGQLHAQLSKASTAEERVDLYNEISFAYRRRYPDSLFHYATLALDEASRIDYVKGKMLAYKHIGIYRYKQGFPTDSTIATIELALTYANQINDYYNQAALNNNLGAVKMSEHKNREAITYFLRGLETLALQNEKSGPSFLQALMNGNVANSYMRLEDYDEALLYLGYAYEVADALNDPSIRSMTTNLYAETLVGLGRKAEAKTHLESAIQLHQELNDFQSLGNTYAVLAEMAIDEKNYQQAGSYVNALKVLTEENNFSVLAIQISILEARIAFGRQDLPEAQSRGEQALAMARQAGKGFYERTAYDILAQVYQAQDDFMNAYRIQTSLVALQDSLNAAEKNILQEEAIARYNLSVKEQEITFLNQSKQQQSIWIAVLASLSAAALFLLAIALFYQRKSRQNSEEVNRKNEELKSYIDKNLELENFAYIASHDLKSPLRNIISFSQMLERKLLNGEYEQAIEYLPYITNGSKELKALTDDLLAYSVLGKQELTLQPVRVDDLLYEVLSQLKSEVEAAEAKVQILFQNVSVAGDPTQLRQLFQNLLVNAMKFVAPGDKPSVKISAEDLGQEWKITVQDNGIGIDPEFQETIFLLLKRLHTRDVYEGTGIGLAICKRIVEQHQGSIWVDSKRGEGSAFQIVLPKAS